MEKVWRDGFRIGFDGDLGEFVGLVGTDDWAVELTLLEFAEFRRLALALAGTMNSMALMSQESLTCELECEDLWMEVEGFPQDYSLRFILSRGRRVEGEWTSAIGFVRALESMDPG
jgi:hypothetical protein